MEQIFNLLPSTSHWIVMVFCAILIGFSKTGFSGIGTIVVAIMALAFGAKPSTGLMLPMLCLADIGAIVYYRRSCSWRHLFKLLIWAVVGLFVGIGVDHFVPTSGFKYLIASSILIGAFVLLYNETQKKKLADNGVMHKHWVLALHGVLGGFTTMVGNAAGPIMSVYLLSVKMPKYLFVGTSAWFFMAINYIKMPLQIWVWDNIHTKSIFVSLVMIPFILIGSAIGIYVVKIIPESIFRKVVIWITLLSAAVLLI